MDQLYFFADRRLNNATCYWWILQDSVGKLGVSSGGFSGAHVEGDILNGWSHFVNGGSIAEIQASKWTNGALDPTQSFQLPVCEVTAVTVNSPPLELCSKKQEPQELTLQSLSRDYWF
jgi:hypothetical protein